MKLAKILTATLIAFAATVASADPSCSHLQNAGITADTYSGSVSSVVQTKKPNPYVHATTVKGER